MELSGSLIVLVLVAVASRIISLAVSRHELGVRGWSSDGVLMEYCISEQITTVPHAKVEFHDHQKTRV